MAAKRFLHAYYVLNVLLLLAYVALRIQRLRSLELSMEDMFGITREQQIYISLALILVTRSLSAPTLDTYLADAFMFARAAVLVCLYYMEPRLAVVFAALWTLLFAVCPQPRYRLPDSIATLNNASFQERIARNPHRTVYVLWCHATWSARCSQLVPVLAALSKRYRHPRLRFARLDVSTFPDVAETLGISVSAAVKQLPTVICFRQGKEVARIPMCDERGTIPKQWTRGFTAAHVAQELRLNEQLGIVKQWETEAQQKYRQKKKN